MDRQIRRLGVAFLAMFVLAFGAVNYVQVFAAKTLADNPANQRVLLQEYSVKRGQILARDDRTVLAFSRRTKGLYKYLRVYPHGSLYGQITGFSSLIYGRTGLEASQNDYLSGSASELLPQNLVDEMLGRQKQGATVVTTVDAKLQVVARHALGSLPGAVVAGDPATGDVLAMVANPSYDPNPLASHSTAEARAAERRLVKSSSKPLLSRASQELFAPGSTFKVVTASAALEDGMTPSTRFPNPPQLSVPQTTHKLQNFGGEHCLGGIPELTLAQALQVSCNVVFGEIGLKLGGDKLRAQAERFGFNGDVPFDLPFAEGQIPASSLNSPPAVAFSAIGQQSVGANPMQMALVGAAIANGGVEMRPRLVSEIRDPAGRVVRRFEPQVFGKPISSKTAAEMTQMMINVVKAGTGTPAQIPGVDVAGKTGTAQTAGGKPHAWFVCFAPAQHPKLVVAVIVLNGGALGSDATGGVVAAPIAKRVLEAGL
jgi:peptidoglycan glycosyltransferase